MKRIKEIEEKNPNINPATGSMALGLLEELKRRESTDRGKPKKAMFGDPYKS